MSLKHIPAPAPPPFIVFGAPAIGEDEIAEVVDSLRSGWIGTGPKVARFEEAFAGYRGAPHAVAVNSCTAALHLAMLASGIGPGDEVITTPLTFCATVNAILHVGATPVLADVDPRTMNIDPRRVAAAVTPRTRAILPVHFAGRPCDMDAIAAIAREHDLLVIEDCAHAVESEHRGRSLGTIGDYGCFSFYVTKNLCTGEGGMVVTRDAAAAGRIRTLALHGLTRDAWKRFSDDGYQHYEVVETGYKYNMTDLQAAMGLHQLRRVESGWLVRRAIWHRYLEAFADLPVTLPAPPEPDTRHGHHLFTLLIDPRVCGVQRDELLQSMTARRIGVGVHYLSLPEHRCYRQRLGWRPEDHPAAMRIGRQTVSLPLSPRLSESDVERVIDALRAALSAGVSGRLRRAA